MASKPLTITLTDEIQRRHGHAHQQAGIGEADDKYTPEQRLAIDAQLDNAEKGPFHGPFDSASEMITHIKGAVKKRAAIKRKGP